LLANNIEPDLHLIQPGSIGGSIVHVEARSGGQPAPYFLVLMGGVVVHYQVDIQVRQHIGIDMVEEPQKFLMPVARLASGQDLAGSNVQGGEQGSIAQAHGQEGLGAVPGPGPGFFRPRTAPGPYRAGSNRGRPCPAPSPQRRGPFRGEFEVLLAMRLQAEGPPNPVYRGIGHPGFSGQGPAGLMGAGFRVGFQSSAQQSGHLFVDDGPGRSRPGFLIQACQPLVQEAPAPFAH